MHFRPLEAAGFAGAALLTQPRAQAARAIDSLAPVLARTPQGQLVMALSAPQRLRGRAEQAQHALYRDLVAEAPHMVDAQLAWAQLQLNEHNDAAALALLSPLAMEGAPDTWARAAHLMWQAGNTTALSTLLARRLTQTQGIQLAQGLAQASAPHRAILRRLVMRHLLAQGDTVGALSWARAQAEAQPKGLLSQWDYLRLAELNHTALPPQAVAVVQGDQGHRALVALSVRLAAERSHSEALRAVAAPLQPALATRPITERLATALEAEAQGQRARALSALRGTKISVQEAPAIITLSQVMLASLRPTLPADALDALEAIHPLPARLDTEMPRPDINELYARTMVAADAASRPAAALRAARALFWRDPLAQDPIALLRRAAEWDLTLSLRPGAASQKLMAFRAIEQLIEARPSDDALVETAITMAERGDPARAPGYVATLLKRHPQDPALTARLVEAYLAAGDRAQARAWLKLDDKSAQAGADEPPIAYAKALVLSEEAPQRARALLNHAIEQRPEARMFAALADLDIKDHQLDDALMHLGRAAELCGPLNPYALRRARILVSLKRDEEARAILAPLLKAGGLRPEDGEAWLLMADIEREVGSAQTVAHALEQALQAAPERDDVALRLARLLLQELGRPQEALARLQALVARAPNDAPAQYFLAVALRETRSGRAADAAFARYLKLAPEGEYATDAREARAASNLP
jgi:predicted Zn-dependent protease